MRTRREKRDPKDPRNQERQKARKWGHEKGFAWVNLEEFDRRCTLHPRIIIRRKFFGRRVVVLEDRLCRMRVMLRKAMKGAAIDAKDLKPEVELPMEPMFPSLRPRWEP